MSSSFILCNNDESVLDGIVMYDEKWILYNNQQRPVQWLDSQLQSTSQSQTCIKKRSQSLFGDLLPLIHYGFVNPDEIITCEKYVQQINEMHQKLQCLRWNWSTEWAQFFSRTTSNHTLHNQHFKSWMNRAMKFCLIHLIHLTSCQLTTTSSSILTTSCRENASTTSRRQKMLSKISLNPKAWVFML